MSIDFRADIVKQQRDEILRLRAENERLQEQMGLACEKWLDKVLEAKRLRAEVQRQASELRRLGALSHENYAAAVSAIVTVGGKVIHPCEPLVYVISPSGRTLREG